MKDFLEPSPGLRAQLKDGGAVGRLEAEFATRGFRRFDRGKRNFEAKVAAEENFACFEQRFSLRLLLANAHFAEGFVAHGSIPRLRLFAKFFFEGSEVSIHRAGIAKHEIGRASCRERVQLSVVA